MAFLPHCANLTFLSLFAISAAVSTLAVVVIEKTLNASFHSFSFSGNIFPACYEDRTRGRSNDKEHTNVCNAFDSFQQSNIFVINFLRN